MVIVCNAVSPWMRSNSADALPQTNVPVPAPFALKLNPGSVHVPEAHVNGPSLLWRLLPAKRRATPCTTYPCTTRPEAGAPVPLLTLAAAVPSGPAILRVVGLTPTRAHLALSSPVPGRPPGCAAQFSGFSTRGEVVKL